MSGHLVNSYHCQFFVSGCVYLYHFVVLKYSLISREDLFEEAKRTAFDSGKIELTCKKFKD
jgi:hypothetical protein